MDYQYKTTGSIISGIVVIICSLITAPIAVGLLLSYPHAIWWLGIPLFFGVLLLFFSGIHTIKKSRTEEKRAQQFLLAMHLESEKNKNTIPTNIKSDHIKPIVLVRWEFSSDEWNRFFKREVIELFTESLILFALISLLGTVFLMYTEGASLSVSLSVSSTIAAVISLLKYLLKKKTIHFVNQQKIIVTIGLDTIILNGKLVALREDNKWLRSISIKNDSHSLPVIEFVYGWNTRKGETFDEFRIPIPENKLNEAQEVIGKIKAHHSIP